MPRDIGLAGIQRIVDTQCGIQAHVACSGSIDVTYVDSRVSCRVCTARHKDVAARLHVQHAVRLYAQRHIGFDRKGHQLAVLPIGGNIGSAHVHELLHVLDLPASGQVLHGNGGGLVSIGSHCAP